MREELMINDSLEFSLGESYIIDKLLSSGSSVLVYLGHHKFSRRPVIIKEFYPIDDEVIIERDNTSLMANDEDLFNKVKEDFKTRILEFTTAINNSFKDMQVYNNFAKANIILEDYNNTVYIIQDYNYGKVYSEYEETSLDELVTNILSITKIVYEIHKLGYIIFDIKPSNLFMIDAVGQKLFNLIDFDSITKYHENITSFKTSLNYSADDEVISYKYDIYAIACILKERLLNFYPEDYLPIVFNLLNDILGNCLCPQDKRYDDETLITKLEELLEYANIKSLLISNPKSVNCFGREELFEQIKTKIIKDHFVCLNGIKGIGKYTAACAYANKYREVYDQIQIIDFDDSWEAAFKNFNFEKDFKANDKISDKDKVVIALNLHKPSLLVINNYIPNILNDKIVEELLSFGCDIIVISDDEMQDSIIVETLSEDAAIETFIANYQKPVEEISLKYLKEILKYTAYIPSIIKLHAQSLRNANFEDHLFFKTNPFKEYLKLLKTNGLAYLSPDNNQSLLMHYRYLLGLDNLETEYLKILYVLYFLKESRLKESDLVNFKLKKDKAIEMCNKQLLSRTHGYIEVNSVLKEIIFELTLEHNPSLSDDLLNILIGINNPNYIYATLLNLNNEDIKLKASKLYFDDLVSKTDLGLIDKYAEQFKALNLIDNFTYDLILNERRQHSYDALKMINSKITSEKEIINQFKLDEAYRLHKLATEFLHNGKFNDALYNYIKSNVVAIKCHDDTLEIDNYLGIIRVSKAIINYPSLKHYLDLIKVKLSDNHPHDLHLVYYFEYACYIYNSYLMYKNYSIKEAIIATKDYFEILTREDLKYKENFDSISILLSLMFQVLSPHFKATYRYNDYHLDDELFETCHALVNLVEKVYFMNHRKPDYKIYKVNLYICLYSLAYRNFALYELVEDYLEAVKETDVKINIINHNAILSCFDALAANPDVLKLDTDKLISNLKILYEHSSFRQAKLNVMASAILFASYFKVFRNDELLEFIEEIKDDYPNESRFYKNQKLVNRLYEQIDNKPATKNVNLLNIFEEMLVKDIYLNPNYFKPKYIPDNNDEYILLINDICKTLNDKLDNLETNLFDNSYIIKQSATY